MRLPLAMLKPWVENIFQFSGCSAKSVPAIEVGRTTKRGPELCMKSAARRLFNGTRKPRTLGTAKIPDKAWLVEIDCAKFHVWTQVVARFLEKLICREKPGDKRRNDKSNCKIGRSRCQNAIPEETRRVFRGQPASKQKGEQRKRRQGVMRQLGFYERENDENDRNANDKVIIDFIPVVVWIGLSAVALANAMIPPFSRPTASGSTTAVLSTTEKNLKRSLQNRTARAGDTSQMNPHHDLPWWQASDR